MTVDMAKIVAGKRALRRKLAALPIEQKLDMLDRLRQRTLDIRAGLIKKK